MRIQICLPKPIAITQGPSLTRPLPPLPSTAEGGLDEE